MMLMIIMRMLMVMHGDGDDDDAHGDDDGDDDDDGDNDDLTYDNQVPFPCHPLPHKLLFQLSRRKYKNHHLGH